MWNIIAALLLLAATAATAAESVTIELRETAGIRRFTYPVAVALELPAPVSRNTNVRLLLDDKPIVAQFRADRVRQGGSHFWVDFHTNLLPYQSKTYTLQYGPDVPAGPERKSGHELTESGDEWHIENAPYISWTIPRDLGGLLKSVNFPPAEHLRAESPGLVLLDQAGQAHPLGAATGNRTLGRVVREGPLAVALRFEVAHTNPELQGVRSIVDLHLPVAKSWVAVDWKVIDPDKKTSALRAELHLNLDKPTSSLPTLVDFGTTTLVYTALRPRQQTELRAASTTGPHAGSGSAWQILRGSVGSLEPFVFGPKGYARNAQGWAHVMDRKRCLALAVNNFARRTDDRINISAEGKVLLERSLNRNETSAHNPKQMSFRFWLHFVHFPPQHSAATSPQAMQNPVAVRVLN